MRGLRACWRACLGFGGFSAVRNFSWQAALWAAAPAGPAEPFARMLLGGYRAARPSAR